MRLLLLFSIVFSFYTYPVEKGLPDGFVYLDDIAPGIIVDLRYYSVKNFVGKRIDGYENDRCICTQELAKALRNVQDALDKEGLGLKVFDAYRPQRAVNHFMAWAKDINDTLMKRDYYPNVPKSRLFTDGYIAEKSGHSRGSTVDLTLVYLNGNNQGEEMDMGSPWDFLGPKSWPTSNAVTQEQRQNRMLLQQLMVAHGFKPLKEEWWHFTLKNEPFPKTYFDFPVQ